MPNHGSVRGYDALTVLRQELPQLPSDESLPSSAPTAPSLSRREVEVVLAWLLTDSKSDVCRTLFISAGTVNTHIARVREKYALVGRPAPSKAALLARALQDGHITLEDI